MKSLYQTKLSQASLQQVTSSTSLSLWAITVCLLYPAVNLQRIKREHSKAAGQLFKLMTDCNEKKHGQSVLIFFFSGAIASSVILFTLSSLQPALLSLQVMPTVIICPLL